MSSEEPGDRARAYADIVGLADGAAKDSVDHELTGRTGEAEAARGRAIEHVRQGLALLGSETIPDDAFVSVHPVLGPSLLVGALALEHAEDRARHKDSEFQIRSPELGSFRNRRVESAS